MRKVLEVLIGTSVLVIGTCVGEDALKLSPIYRYGDSGNAVGWCENPDWFAAGYIRYIDCDARH